MKKSEITRQHEETSMTEIVGECCQDFIVVYDGGDETYHVFYLKLSNIYHRFHTDTGVLFWQSDYPPDEEDDICFENERYIDLGKEYDLVGSFVDTIVMQNDRLDMKFSNGVRLLFEERCDDDGARLIEATYNRN